MLQKFMLPMKPTNKKQKTFDTVKTFRDIKERIAKEIYPMSFEELKAYLSQRRLRHKKSA